MDFKDAELNRSRNRNRLIDIRLTEEGKEIIVLILQPVVINPEEQN